MFKQIQKLYENCRDKQEICRQLKIDPEKFDYEEFLKFGDQTRWTHPVFKGLNDFLDCPREIVYKRGLDLTKLSLFVNEKIVSNYSKISESDRKKLNAKYFIMILNPYDELIKHPAEKIATLSDYSNYIKNRFAVRAFPIETGKTHVLVEEVSEIVKLALQKKPNVTKEDFERAHMFLWDYEDKNVYRTVSVGHFVAIMKKLEVDQSLITLVPCVVWVYTSMAALQEPMAPVGIFNGDGEMIITGPQAMLYTFQSIVCGTNWDSIECGGKLNIEKISLASQFREEVFAVLESYSKSPEGSMITKKFVDERISYLRTVLARCQLTQVPDCFYQNLSYSDRISYESFKRKREELGYSNLSSMILRDSFPVQEVRMLFTFGAIRKFFPFNLEDMAMQIVHELGCMIPKEFRDELIVELKKNIGEELKSIKRFCQKVSNISKRSEGLEMPSETETDQKTQDNSSEPSQTTSESMKTSVTSSENELERMELPEQSANKKSAPVEAQYITALEKRILPDFDMDKFLEELGDRAQKNVGKLEECGSGVGKKTSEDSMISESGAKAAEVVATPSEVSKAEKAEDSEKARSNLTSPEPEDIQLPSEDPKIEEVELKPAEIFQEIHGSLNFEPTLVTQDSKSDLPKLAVTKKENVKPKVTKTFETLKKVSSEPKSSEPEKPKSKLCDKCTRNGQKLLEAQEELKLAVNKAKKYEDKAQKTMKVEKDVKKVKKEMEDLKKELERMRNETKDSKLREQKLEKSKKKLEEDIEKLKNENLREQQKTIHAQQQISQLTQKVDAIQLKFTLKQSQLESELEKKTGIIGELRRTNSRTSGISADPSMSNLNPLHPRKKLLEYQRIKDDFEKDQSLNWARAAIKKLSSSSENPEIWQFCEFEMDQFENCCRIYMEIVELNIRKIKKTDDISDLFPLPKYPELSNKFLEKNAKNQEVPKSSELSTSSDASMASSESFTPSSQVGFDPKLECYICNEPFLEGEKVFVCKGCNNPTHQKCGKHWSQAQKELNVKDESCGFCRRRMEVEKMGKKK